MFFMELPKNIVQIGESDKTCKVYIEDFCFSYLKQLNVQACSKHIAVALYGNSREEEEISYLFVYCACRVLFLEKDTKYLPQAAAQDIEKQRKRYFPEYSFLGYYILDGEMMEGIHAFLHGTCRYVGGYARFYEKNDRMLQYMLSEKKGDNPPEEVNSEKYEAVRKRQEERRQQAEIYQKQSRKRKTLIPGEVNEPGKNYSLRFAGTAAVLALGVGGALFMGNAGQLKGLFQSAQRTWEELARKQLPEVTPVSGSNIRVDKIVAEEQLNEAILEENKSVSQPEEEISVSDSVAEEMISTGNQPESDSVEVAAGEAESTAASSAEVVQQEPAVATEETKEVAKPTKYTVKRGDTLLDICKARYGDETMLEEICGLNHIVDPNDIKAGQKILLP